VLVVCLGVVVLSYVLYRGLGSEFLPEFDEGAFVLDYFTPSGTSLSETDRILRHVEQMLKETRKSKVIHGALAYSSGCQ
jgi:multidrug efflux pump subunit AcrB